MRSQKHWGVNKFTVIKQNPQDNEKKNIQMCLFDFYKVSILKESKKSILFMCMYQINAEYKHKIKILPNCASFLVYM